ncbi:MULTISPECIES: lipase [unclassified Shewanella]|uniref:lipase family alpha/beta hydrolase n=1 Tax=unclassified Shewanella TaxID=196818 RepID=UPI001BC66105|nr:MULTISPECIES: lipase [unclassified Shewanella]GIU19394.1 alpha/beta hydrolase [Shewanella sp. MBTL60-112-B1]GIU24917.1 alpha/beta hydrolase [Shewanella sp. MBTL60-112-B2]
MKVVLVHGIFNTGQVMRVLQRRLQQAGRQCFSPTISPFDGRHGIEHAAKELGQQIDAVFGVDANIVLVGFSMGGIVGRYYMQRLNGARRVSQFFSLSTPHNGSYLAYLPYPSKGIKQLRPNSDLLVELARSEAVLEGVKLYSYWTPIDFTIVPSSSSVWRAADNKSFIIILHLSVIFSRRIAQAICDEIDK